MKRFLGLSLTILILLSFSLAACTPTQPQVQAQIPILRFEGDLSGMVDKSDVRDIKVTYTSAENSFEAFATVKFQGNSTLAYDKKNYTLKLYGDEAHTEKHRVDLGWGPQSEYCLKANWIDHTMSRNVVSAKLVTQVQRKYDVLTQAPTNCAVDGFPVEIHINGEFHGIYTFNIPKSEWLFAMDSDNPNHIVFSSEEWEPANKFLAMPDWETWSVEVGPEDEASMEKLSTLFHFILDSSDEEFIQDFDSHMNLDATLHYYILADFMYLTDNLGKNMLLGTYDGQVWYPMLYDMDSSWGSRSHGTSQTPYRDQGLSLTGNHLWNRMETCFPKELSARYFELRQELLTKEYIMGLFEAFRSQIPQESFDRETARWGADRPGYSYAQIEEFLDIVIPRLDEKYEAMAGN